MEHESVGQGDLLRKHSELCVNRVAPNNLMFLGAGMGNGLESDVVSHLEDILAVDLNPEYLTKTWQAVLTFGTTNVVLRFPR